MPSLNIRMGEGQSYRLKPCQPRHPNIGAPERCTARTYETADARGESARRLVGTDQRHQEE